MKRTSRWLIPLVTLLLMVGWVMSSSLAQANLFQAFIQDVRNDMELLANRVFAGTRPEAWTGNAVLDSPTVVADLWFDNELLADAVYGAGNRPQDWIGATSANAEIVTRNIRHDLEIAASQFLGVSIRPDGWIGAPPLFGCSRTTQNIILLLNTQFTIQLPDIEGVIDYCGTLETDIDNIYIPEILGVGDVAPPQDVQGLIWGVRGDLERLANETQGLDNRPSGWIGNTNIDSPDLAPDLFSDLGRLADAILGNGNRPEGWSGLITESLTVSHRNLRSDLELLADATPNLGIGVRPSGWEGADPLILCSTNTQNLLVLLRQAFNYELDPALTAETANYCQLVTQIANDFTENPPIEVVEAQDTRFVYEAANAFSYLDAAATQFMGPMPFGVEFRAWYRNFGGSSMMFVSGADFAVYIDRRWTTMPQEVFDTLPTLDGVIPLTFCDAVWCNGPRPTPTPTGRGPLADIINAATPPATIDPNAVQGEGKQLVSWNHIRINYLLQRPEVGAAQVTLEICSDVSQINCEPVVNVFNNAVGTNVPVVSQFNGLNVYELPYGYSTNFVVEGLTLFSTDIWLSDPALLTPVGS